jgi:FAD-dependent monooxygenase
LLASVGWCDSTSSRTSQRFFRLLITGEYLQTDGYVLGAFQIPRLDHASQQGQFWHIFFSHGGVIISQDEVDTWTTHLPISLDTDWASLDAEEAIRTVLKGSCTTPPPSIKIDNILVKSAWRPNICIAERYTSKGTRVFLSGDAAHQNIPTGGYGMNTAVGDSFDIGWKLAAVVKGYGGRSLLDSYEVERKPVAVRNIERSGVHHQVHFHYVGWVRDAGPGVVLTDEGKGRQLRQRIADHVRSRDGENQDHGVELGYRYEGSPVIFPDSHMRAALEWNYRHYIPSTWPGSRAPHVYLADGDTSIFDLFSHDYTLVDFSKDGSWAAQFSKTAARLEIPLKIVHLPDEAHHAQVWERQALLVRPDDHVAWRAPVEVAAAEVDVERVLEIATGSWSSLAASRDGHHRVAKYV